MIHPAYRTADVDGFEVFYREAGDRPKPTLLLLHGFPTSSHMFRDLIPLLADRFHLVAPDLPGFGLSALPARNQFAYTFDNLAQVIGRFTEVIGLDQFAIYIFDYGAPTGLRMAMAHPERITAIISQNGNAYKEGLSDGWNPIERYWRDPSDANRQALRELLAPGSIRWQYEHGVPEITAISPDGIALDAWYMLRPQEDEVQLDLMPKIRDEILEDAAALVGKGFFAHFGQCNGWLVSCQPALRAIFCPWAGIFEGFRHRYAGGGSSFGFPRARPAPEITTSPEWRLLPA
jgi:pimeloyl-ACP methyl ester carboxylesterase